MKPDLRISIKDYRRGKNLKGLVVQVPFGARQFQVRRNGEAWLSSGRPVSLTRRVTALRMALVKAQD